VREILRGQWLALTRQFGWPLVVILTAEFLLLREQFVLEVVLINLGMLLADILTLGWVGMWLGLTARSLNRAIVGSIGRVLVLPWVAYYLLICTLEVLERLYGSGLFEVDDTFRLYTWFAIGLVVNGLFGFWWARGHLARDFREAASQRYQSQRFGWFQRRPQAREVAPIRASAVPSR
jgi:hypothetical protein